MTDSKEPTHRAFVVKKFTDKDGNEKSRWLDIGTVWTHRDGKGFDVSLVRRSRLTDASSSGSTNPKPQLDARGPGVSLAPNFPESV